MAEYENSIVIPDSLTPDQREQITQDCSPGTANLTGEQFFQAVELLGPSASVSELVALVRFCTKKNDEIHN